MVFRVKKWVERYTVMYLFLPNAPFLFTTVNVKILKNKIVEYENYQNCF